MKIGVISDTHDQFLLIQKAVEEFNKKEVEVVIHCGDWVSPFILQFFQNLKAPIYTVFGNNDGDKVRHIIFKDKLNLNIQYSKNGFFELEFDNRIIGILHGESKKIIEALVASKKYDAIFYGHTHQKVNEKHKNTLLLNPGSLMIETNDSLKGASIAIYDTTKNDAYHINLES